MSNHYTFMKNLLESKLFESYIETNKPTEIMQLNIMHDMLSSEATHERNLLERAMNPPMLQNMSEMVKRTYDIAKQAEESGLVLRPVDVHKLESVIVEDAHPYEQLKQDNPRVYIDMFKKQMKAITDALSNLIESSEYDKQQEFHDTHGYGEDYHTFEDTGKK